MCSIMANAQQDEPSADVSKVTVIIELLKKSFRKAEKITYSIRLINDGPAFYVPKSFAASFRDSVEQLTGRPPRIGCGVGGGMGGPRDTRSANQILREDYLRLGQGESIGITAEYPKCMDVSVLNEGTYEITASFRPQIPVAINAKDFRDLYPTPKFLVTEVNAKPVRFRITPK